MTDPVHGFQTLVGTLLREAQAALGQESLVEGERKVLTAAIPAYRHTAGALADKCLAPNGVPDPELFALIDAYTNAVLAIGALAFQTKSAREHFNKEHTAAARETREARRRSDGKISPKELSEFVVTVLSLDEIDHPTTASKKHLGRINRALAEKGLKPVSSAVAEKAIAEAKRKLPKPEL